ncbi:MAG TPA: DUF4190 domain-containing protein [Anaerolineales bacterium]|nr:DUF4190 domain-containing protein [Anaerolineales bacterium]
MNDKVLSGKALLSLILSLLGLSGLPLIGSIAAIILANKADIDFRVDPTLGGQGLAKAGRILGWIGVVIGGAFCLVVFAIFVLAIVQGGEITIRPSSLFTSGETF